MGNANFACVQHFIHRLAAQGMASFVTANGSMSSTQSGEGDIRRTRPIVFSKLTLRNANRDHSHARHTIKATPR